MLNKPLAPGLMLARTMRGHAASDQVAGALRAMETSNAPALAVLERFGVSSLTDVTGFGLLGHLAEMLRASAVGASISAAAVPALPGACELLAAGIRSSLHRNNVQVLGDFEQEPGLSQARLDLLVDPQTSGGLLAGVPAGQAEACVAALREAGYPRACVIGTVTDAWRITA